MLRAMEMHDIFIATGNKRHGGGAWGRILGSQKGKNVIDLFLLVSGTHVRGKGKTDAGSVR